MTEHEVSRTLVKSPPELWAECSQASTLARHLDQFGELKITRLEPEIAVAWEGERASGTVRLEPTGWGTKVVLKARPLPDPAAAQAPAVVTQPAPPPRAEPPTTKSPPLEPAPLPQPSPDPEELPRAGDELPGRRRFFGRLMSRFLARPAPEIELRQVEPVEPEPEPDPAPQRQLPTRRARPVEIARLYGDDLEPASAPPPDPPAAPDAAPEPEAAELNSALAAALESLGQAHHRPFSRG
jgi:hypothetical protein